MHSLKNKTALICGATSGIGLAVAQNFVSNGAVVVITGRRDEGTQIAAEIGAQFIRCDASIETEVEDCFQQAESL
ncbi:MAG: SDR family NAD(P)-dependent oxidoreductase, partial [Lysobacterales bacterium]